MRRAKIYCFNRLAGYLQEDESGFSFAYNADYLQEIDAVPVSLTLPLQAEPYRSSQMFSFFDGLIPEGWLLDVAQENWKLNPRDRMGLLLACCKDCIGAVSVRKEDE
ncbi:MAG: HipA N-terminal domain-containing protein [Paludibacteraceae bacterium]